MAVFLHWDLANSHRLVMEPAFLAVVMASGAGSIAFGGSQETGPRTITASSPAVPLAATPATHLTIRSKAPAGMAGEATLRAPVPGNAPVRHAMEGRGIGLDHGMRLAVPSATPAGIIPMRRETELQAGAGNGAAPGAAPAASLAPSHVPLAKIAPESVFGNGAAEPDILQRPGDQPFTRPGAPLAGEITLMAGVQDFDLARIAGSSTSVTRAPGLLAIPEKDAARFASSPPPRTELRQNAPGQADRIVGEFIFHEATAQINDHQAGRIDVRIEGNGDLSVRLGDLLSLCEETMEPDAFAGLAASSSAAEYVTFATMRDAGIDVRYDAANDRIVLAAR